MRRAALASSGLIWLAVGALAWTRALAVQAVTAGAGAGHWFFFPSWLDAALTALPWLAAAAWLLSCLAREPKISARAAAVLAVAGAAAVWPPAGSGAPALAAAAAAWAPALVWFLTRISAVPARPTETGPDEGRALAAGLATATALWGAAATLGPWPGAWGLAWAALLFAAVGTGLAAAVMLAPSCGTGYGKAFAMMAALAGAHGLKRLVLESVGLDGLAAWAVGLPPAAAAVAAWSAANPAALFERLPTRARFVALPTLALGLAAAAAWLESATDWAHGAQGLVCAAAWPLCYSAAQAGLPRRWRLPGGAAGPTALCVGLFLLPLLSPARLLARAEAGAARAASVMPLVRFVERIARRGTDRAALFAALRQRSFQALDRPAPPVPIRLVDAWGPSRGMQPDIFVFVVDSMRRDRLRTYFPQAAPLPAFEALAAESLIFRNAFTPYAGTMLAVASLWTGAWLPHKPLAAPYAPQNALEALLAREGYERLITPDVVVRALTMPPPATGLLAEPDDDRRGLCGTLEALTARLARRKPGAPPLFAFAHGYDLHAAVRQAQSAAPDAGYQEALIGVDACLGRFIKHLKAAGRWERTVLVVTADHGDSFGEEGRWGHAYAVAPELARIPLLLRVPVRLQKNLSVDLDAPAFLNDLTATFYALLGHQPQREGFPYGRALLRPAGNPAPPGPWLVASSYAPVFARLDASGRRLVVADAVDRSATGYELSAQGPDRRVPLTQTEADEVGRWILGRLDDLAKFYKLP